MIEEMAVTDMDKAKQSMHCSKSMGIALKRVMNEISRVGENSKILCNALATTEKTVLLAS